MSSWKGDARGFRDLLYLAVALCGGGQLRAFHRPAAADGETYETALQRIRALPAVKKYGARGIHVQVRPAVYTGLVLSDRLLFSDLGFGGRRARRRGRWRTLTGACTGSQRWINGRFPPTASPLWDGFIFPASGSVPARRRKAHAPNEKTWKEDLVRCARRYMRLCPKVIKNTINNKDK